MLDVARPDFRLILCPEGAVLVRVALAANLDFPLQFPDFFIDAIFRETVL